MLFLQFVSVIPGLKKYEINFYYSLGKFSRIQIYDIYCLFFEENKTISKCRLLKILSSNLSVVYGLGILLRLIIHQHVITETCYNFCIQNIDNSIHFVCQAYRLLSNLTAPDARIDMIVLTASYKRETHCWWNMYLRCTVLINRAFWCAFAKSDET